MELEPWIKVLLSEYGPLALGWVVASILAWRVFADAASNRLSTKDVVENYQELMNSYHEAIVANTKVTERLALLIEERTRRQVNGQSNS